MEEEISILTRYISAWNWQIIAVIFLATTIIAGMLQQIPYLIGCALGMGFAEFMALKRKREIYNEQE